MAVGLDTLVKNFEKKYMKKRTPDVRPGYTVRVFQKIKEGEKERTQAFEGLVISQKGGRGLNANIKVRKISFGVGVEKTFLLHAPSIEKIEVVKKSVVRRAKLYYMRKRTGKGTRLVEDKEGLAKLKAQEKAAIAADEALLAAEAAPTEEVAAVTEEAAETPAA